MEKFHQTSKTPVAESHCPPPPPQNPVEAEANFEGNDTEVLIRRLRNPIIKNQILGIIYEQKTNRLNLLKDEEWEPYLPEGWTGEERFKLLEGKNSGKIISTEDLEAELRLPEADLKEIEAELDGDIDQIERVTEINFTSNGPDAEVIPLNWVIPWSGKKPTSKQMSIIEAHEKGHRIRHYDGLTDEFRKAFEIARVTFTKEDYDILKKDAENHTDQPIDTDPAVTLEEKRNRYLNEYLFTGMEIAERMSQLKNYFGFKGSEQFTREHLEYAKEHYIPDTDMDNGMKLFFQAITPGTEAKFLEIMNGAGI